MNSGEKIDSLWEFCERVDAEWQKKNYDTHVFPNIVEALDARAHCDLDYFSDLRCLRSCLDIPKVAEIQRLSSFSDVYYRLFDNGRFWVEVLNWWGSDINIHDHDFSAVQYQLKGVALNVEYQFESNGSSSDNVAYGSFSVKEAKLWQAGGHSIVRPGRVAPHNICHIDHPTVSLLIRTHPDPNFGPQQNYFPPKVASSYGIADAVFRKNVKSLRLLATRSKSVFSETLADFARHRSDSQRLFAAIKMVDILFQEEHKGDLETLIGNQRDLLESVSYFRVMEEIKYFKNIADLSFDQKLALSVIGTAYDADSLDEICSQIFGSNAEKALLPSLMTLTQSVNRIDTLRIAKVIALYGLDMLGLDNVA